MNDEKYGRVLREKYNYTPKKYYEETCKKILWVKKDNEWKQELEQELEKQKEDLKNNGEDEEKAEIKAISQMGNAKEIGKKLNKIHKPKLDWKLLIITLVLIFFGNKRVTAKSYHQSGTRTGSFQTETSCNGRV